MDALHSIFPARRTWPSAIADVAAAPQDVTEIRLVAGARNFDRLRTYTKLEALWCFDINGNALEAICACTSLKSLYIENLKTDDLRSLRNLRRLEILGIETGSKVRSFVELSELRSLWGLALTHFKNVHDLTPLSDLGALRALAVAGSMWTRMRVASWWPLERLKQLEYLHLTNIKADDESLKPLGQLAMLRQLDIANFYPMKEFAWLAQRLKLTECTWFNPYVAVKHSACKKCGEHSMLMLTGKRKPMLCLRCDGKRIDKHLVEWNQASLAA